MTSNRRPNLRVARPAHELNKPTPGCYRTRRERGGPWLPALVWFEKARDPETGAVLDRPPVLQCMIDGERADLDRVWNHLHPVDEATYRLMAEDRLDPEAVPDFGQDAGRNSRDAQLEAAAEAALDMEMAAVGPQWFRRVALLVSQITACEHDLEAVYRAVAKPLQEQLAALARGVPQRRGGAETGAARGADRLRRGARACVLPGGRRLLAHDGRDRDRGPGRAAAAMPAAEHGCDQSGHRRGPDGAGRGDQHQEEDRDFMTDNGRRGSGACRPITKELASALSSAALANRERARGI